MKLTFPTDMHCHHSTSLINATARAFETPHTDRSQIGVTTWVRPPCSSTTANDNVRPTVSEFESKTGALNDGVLR
jgi:hypothetical protein